jgi:glycosyltransferase involved in cell wall biosynthesis
MVEHERDTTKLLIVDQSLRDLNGHHYEYDVSVSAAAADMGISALIAAHESWDSALGAAGVDITPYFRRSWDDVHQSGLVRIVRRVLTPLPAPVRSSVIWAGSRLRKTLGAERRLSNSSPSELPSFGNELATLIDTEGLTASDHVLVHTLSMAELFAMITVLEMRDKLPIVHVVLRRDADEPAVANGPWGGIKSAFTRVRTSATLRQSLRFYSDTSQLCSQYEALSGGVPVALLPIPHGLSGAISARPTAKRHRPVTATYLGNARTEKGFHYLPKAVDALHSSHIEAGRLRFVIQANANLSLEDDIIARGRRRLRRYASEQVELIDSALDVPGFQERLFEADIILLPYQAEHYRKRSSGILVQALVAGCPVVVPSGTWLSDCAPPESTVTFDDPEHLANAIAIAVERLPELRQAALRMAPAWRERHSAEMLVERLLDLGPVASGGLA